MEPQRAKEILEEEKTRKQGLKQASQVLEAEKQKQEELRKKQEVEQRRQQIEEMSKRFPKKPNDVFTKCWNCNKVVQLNNTEMHASNVRVLRIAECDSCGRFQIDRISNTQRAPLDFIQYIKAFR